MALSTKDLPPKHGDLANDELSIEELEAVAAGSILGDVWNWFKGEVNGKINEYRTAAGTMIDAGRALIHLL